MNKVETIVNHAEAQCKTHGARLTPKRKNVLRSLLASGRALSAYELNDLIRDELNENMPVMSVYRILDFLQQERLVHKLNSTNKYVACEHISCDHAHEVPQFLICDSCQKVKEISIGKSMVKELTNKIAAAGFHLVSPQFEMSCICDSCRSAA